MRLNLAIALVIILCTAFYCQTENRAESQESSAKTVNFEHEVSEPHDSMGRSTGATVYRFVGDAWPEVAWIMDSDGWPVAPEVSSVNIALESLGLPTVTNPGKPIKATNSSDYEWLNYPKGKLRVVTSGCPQNRKKDCIWKVVLPKQP